MIFNMQLQDLLDRRHSGVSFGSRSVCQFGMGEFLQGTNRSEREDHKLPAV
jgi:hypothetical protein